MQVFQSGRFLFGCLVILIAANVFVYRAVDMPRVLVITMLEVGKSHAVLVQSPSGKTLLIDAGRDASILRALGSALPAWQRQIDAVILTSSSITAAGGLPEVMSRYRISTLIRSGAQWSRSQESVLADAINAEWGLRKIIAQRGERLALGDGVYIDILWPDRDSSFARPVDGTLALRISYGTTSFLIQNNLPPRINKWLDTLDANLPLPNMSISSTTPAGVYVSNGEAVSKIK